MVSLVNSHTNATRIVWHLWEIDLRFAPGLPLGWREMFCGLRRILAAGIYHGLVVEAVGGSLGEPRRVEGLVHARE